MDTVSIVLAVGVAMLVWERRRPRRRLVQVAGWVRRAVVLTGVQAAVAFVAADTWDRWLGGVALWHIDAHATMADALIGYLALTFVYYWWHRARHEVPLLWRWFHQLHHSATRIELITSFYKHPVEIVANGVLSSLILYVLLGLEPAAAALAVTFTGVAELFYHWNVRTPYWVEVLFAPLVLFRRLRPVMWATMLGVQIGFLFLLNFADLTTPMLLFHLLTFDPRWIKPTMARGHETIYYDGQCGFCHSIVRFVLAEDRSGHFRFAPLQGRSFESAVSAATRAALPDTFVVLDDRGKVLTRGDAVIHMWGRLGGLWRVLASAFQLVPRALRNFGYDCVGRIRHRLAARPDAMCPLVPAALRVRFGA